MSEQKLTWKLWLKNNNVLDGLVRVSDKQLEKPWNPSDSDCEAAWILYTEIRTRISTQPLHYRSGDEEAALNSLYQLFPLTRDVIKDKGPSCHHFATIAIHVLNVHIRPLTAKWHKKKIEGSIQHDDDRREFRRELSEVQAQLVKFSHLLGIMAEGEEYLGNDTYMSVSDKTDTSEIQNLGSDIPFNKILFDRDVRTSNEVFNAEYGSIRERRNGEDEVKNLTGLACSGGGIRSATFCLGVSQALARHGMLPRIDYLSTVSGGGYFGTFLSSYLNDPDSQNVGLGKDKLPFSQMEQSEPEPIRQLRNNSKYLLKGGLHGKSRMVGLLLFGILVNLLTLLPALFGALTITKVIEFIGVTSDEFQTIVSRTIEILTLLLILITLGLPVIYQFQQSRQKLVARYEMAGITIFFLLAGIWMLGWLLPQIYKYLVYLMGSPDTVLAVIGFLPFLFAGTAFAFGMTSTIGRILIVLAGFAGPVLLLISYMVLINEIPAQWESVVVLLILSGGLVSWLFWINVNQITPHRYYRNRLAETYLLRKGQEDAIDPQPLSKLQSDNPTAPYHLINTAVNLPSSKDPDLRGRDSDFFLFSRHYCGSPMLDYCQTTDLEKKDPNFDLGTAMSVSGAAASSYMGTITNKGLKIWLILLNIRLGYWLPNPKHLADNKGRTIARPFLIWRELFGRFDENSSFVNISDGGHIENLGIYELLRRRCKFIIAIDGEKDSDMKFQSLMKLIRFAQIDFGINIQMDLEDLVINEMGLSKAHISLGKIDYGETNTGYLLYIKSSITGNERDYIVDYQKSHPDFPHETTADQFFSEEQFEAYRALGEHIGEDLFHPELIKGAGDITLESWFGALVYNLRAE